MGEEIRNKFNKSHVCLQKILHFIKNNKFENVVMYVLIKLEIPDIENFLTPG